MCLSFTTLIVVKNKARCPSHRFTGKSEQYIITVNACVTVIHPHAVRGVMHSSKQWPVGKK